MTPATVYATLSPRVAANGAVRTVRLAGGGTRSGYARAPGDWWSGIEALPSSRAALSFDGRRVGATLEPRTLRLVWRPTQPGRLADLAGLVWRDAEALVELDADGGVQELMTGTVTDVSIDLEGVVLTIADRAGELTRPLVDGTFAGTGGIEGDADAEGRIKRRSWGRVFNVEARVFQAANNLHEVGDPAHPLNAIVNVRDKGNAATGLTLVAWQGSIAATIAALAAVDLGDGTAIQAAVAPSIAMLKWWTRPAGPLTADLEGETAGGYTAVPAEFAARIGAAVGGPDFAAGSIAAAAAAKPGSAGIHVGSDADVGTVVTAVLTGVSLHWMLDESGKIRIGQSVFGASVASLVATRSRRLRSHAPVKAVRLGYQQNARVHSDGEIAAVVADGAFTGEVDFDTQVRGPGKPERNATRDEPTGTLNRNPAFTLWDADGLPLGWTIAQGEAFRRDGLADARSGGSLLEMRGRSRLFSDPFPVDPEARYWPQARIRITRGTSGSGAAGQVARLYVSVRWLDEAGATLPAPDLEDVIVFGDADPGDLLKLYVKENIAPPADARSAFIFIDLDGTDPASGARMYVDFAGARDVAPGATVGMTAAQQAEAAARDADIEAIVDRLVAIDDDGVLDRSEKANILIPQDRRFSRQVAASKAAAAEFALSTAALDAAKSAYDAYLTDIDPDWHNVSVDSGFPGGKGAFDAVVEAVEKELADLNARIDEQYSAAEKAKLAGIDPGATATSYESILPLRAARNLPRTIPGDGGWVTSGGASLSANSAGSGWAAHANVERLRIDAAGAYGEALFEVDISGISRLFYRFTIGRTFDAVPNFNVVMRFYQRSGGFVQEFVGSFGVASAVAGGGYTAVTLASSIDIPADTYRARIIFAVPPSSATGHWRIDTHNLFATRPTEAHLGPDGRAESARLMSANLVLGPRNGSNVAVTQSDNGGNVLIDIPANRWAISGATNPIYLDYGAGQLTVPYDRRFWIYVEDPFLAGVTAPAYTAVLDTS
ncbi:MAG: hypothetical protein AAF360_12185, partial [Pseudomonadota bacterium]